MFCMWLTVSVSRLDRSGVVFVHITSRVVSVPGDVYPGLTRKFTDRSEEVDLSFILWDVFLTGVIPTTFP